MDKRKSLAVEAMEEGRDSPGDTIRPIRRRSSIIPRTNSDPLEFNDDSVERGRTRQETVTVSPAVSTNSSRRSLNLGSLAQFTTPQIAAGMAECIKLNTQNKITKKNAFALKMIDFMTYMIKNRDENMSNLQVASTTLDVSAKIYGLRVDVLHQDTMDMVGNLDHEKQDNNEDGDEDTRGSTGEASQPNEKQQKAKRKKKSAKVLTTIESLCCEPEMLKLEPPMLGDGDYQTSDMLLQVIAPKHVGLGLGIHPYNDFILDHHDPKTPEFNEKIPWKLIEIPETADIGKIFTEFEFLNWDSEYNPESQANNWPGQDESVADDAARFDLDASVHMDDDNNEFYNADYMDDNHMEQSRTEVVETAGAAFIGNDPQRRKENIVSLDKTLAQVTMGDYSYFDENALNIRWRSGTQWTVKVANKNLAQTSHLLANRQQAARKKKEFCIDFRAETDEAFEAKFAKMKRMRLAKPKFQAEKIIKPEESTKDLQELFRFNYRPDDTELQPRRPINETGAQENPEDLNLDDYGDLDESRHFDDNVGSNDHSMVQEDNVLSTQNNSQVHEEFGTQGGFTGGNLVEAPKLTKKIYIPFSQRAKKLDMRHLKKCIWNSISGSTDDKENVKNGEAEPVEKEGANEPKPFVNIYSHLPEKLGKNDAKELSFPIAFVSLLHLANEKNLVLTAVDNYSDISIIQA